MDYDTFFNFLKTTESEEVKIAKNFLTKNFEAAKQFFHKEHIFYQYLKDIYYYDTNSKLVRMFWKIF